MKHSRTHFLAMAKDWFTSGGPERIALGTFGTGESVRSLADLLESVATPIDSGASVCLGCKERNPDGSNACPVHGNPLRAGTGTTYGQPRSVMARTVYIDGKFAGKEILGSGAFAPVGVRVPEVAATPPPDSTPVTTAQSPADAGRMSDLKE